VVMGGDAAAMASCFIKQHSTLCAWLAHRRLGRSLCWSRSFGLFSIDISFVQYHLNLDASVGLCVRVGVSVEFQNKNYHVPYAFRVFVAVVRPPNREDHNRIQLQRQAVCSYPFAFVATVCVQFRDYLANPQARFEDEVFVQQDVGDVCMK
jgi:hypothetical protein